MSLNTFDEVDQAVIDDCFCRYTGEEIKALIRERNQAMAERDEAIEMLKEILRYGYISDGHRRAAYNLVVRLGGYQGKTEVQANET